MYVHSKPRELKQCVNRMNLLLNNLVSRSEQRKLALNTRQTKAMLNTTSQIAAHYLLRKTGTVQLAVNDKEIKVVDNNKLLRLHIDHNLTWDKHVNETLSKGYGVWVLFRKLKNMTAQHLWRASTQENIVKLDWLPVKERKEIGHIKATFKALSRSHWPENLKLK